MTLLVGASAAAHGPVSTRSGAAACSIGDPPYQLRRAAACAASQSPISRACASASSSAFTRRRALVVGAQHRREHAACAAGPTMFTIRRARNVSGSSAVDRLLDREPLEQRRAPRRRRSASASWKSSVDASSVERAARDRIGEQRARRASRRRARARGPPSAARRARAGRRARRAAARRARGGAASARGRGVAGRAASARATASREPVGVDVERRRPAVITYWSRTSSLGCSATIAAPRLGRAGPAFERGEVGGREHPVDAELQERRARRSTAFTSSVAGRRATRRRDRGPAGRSATWNWIS